jgi:hypothetical protein
MTEIRISFSQQNMKRFYQSVQRATKVNGSDQIGKDIRLEGGMTNYDEAEYSRLIAIYLS